MIAETTTTNHPEQDNQGSTNNNRVRRKRSAEEKLKIVEEGRQVGLSVSEVCRRHQIAAAQYYLWEKQARKGAVTALKDGPRGRKAPDPSLHLQEEISRLRAAVADLSIENLQLKKGQWP